MRTDKSIKNSILSLISFSISVIIGLISQKIFLKYLGDECLGLNGLYTNIMSMLTITELGLGTAIIYNLYEPVAKKDTERVKSLLQFYKKAYRIIACIVFILSLMILPFLKNIVGEIGLKYSIYIIFWLFSIDAIFSYLLTYKRSILYATQNNYIISLIHTIYIILLNILQMIIIYLTSNYVLYLIAKIVMRLFENLIISYKANKEFPFIKEKSVVPISKSDKKSIFKNIKGLFFHKIGSFIVMGTDNILISYFIGIVYVGLYSNYNLIISSVNTAVTQLFNSISSSVGNLIVTESKEKVYDIYKNIAFINYFISIITSMCLFNLLHPFMVLWIGKKYILGFNILLVLIINYYLTIMRRAITMFKEADGIFYDNRFVPIIESIINIIMSILFIKLFGLVGVFIGTITSTIFLYLYDFPKYGYKRVFDKKGYLFLLDFIKKFALFIIFIVINYYTIYNIEFNSIYFDLIIKLFLSIFLNAFILIIIYHNSNEYKYSKIIIKRLFKKVLNKT